MAALEEVATVDEKIEFIKPNWPAPAHVRAFSTTRIGGVSKSPFDGLNLALHVSDNPKDVLYNRQLITTHAVNPPAWLNQTHSNNIADLDQNPDLSQPCDASLSAQNSQVCAVMTADCLPLLITDVKGQVVAAIHAGWQGLANGIIAKTINAMVTRCRLEPSNILVWLGPAISKDYFEIGSEVKDKLQASMSAIDSSELMKNCFIKSNRGDCKANCEVSSNREDKWYADVYAIAKAQLASVGVSQVYGGEYCTYRDEAKFYSHRRATHLGLSSTGRMVSVIGLI